MACSCSSIPTPLEFGQMLHWVCLCLLLLLTRQISTSTWILFVSTTLFIKNHSIPFYGILEINKQVTAHNFLFLLTKNVVYFNCLLNSTTKIHNPFNVNPGKSCYFKSNHALSMLGTKNLNLAPKNHA